MFKIMTHLSAVYCELEEKSVDIHYVFAQLEFYR